MSEISVARFLGSETDYSVFVDAGHVWFGNSSGSGRLIELRSPVRQNDQYTVTESVNLSTGYDVDGDWVEDLADVAIFKKVRGTETVTIAAGSFSTIRVDTHNLVRIKMSGGGAPVTVELIEAHWYARGIGIVKRTIASSASGRPLEQEEELINWDGVSEGIGVGFNSYVHPPDEPSNHVRLPIELLDFGTHNLLVSDRGAVSSGSNWTGLRLSRLDDRGRMLTSNDHPVSIFPMQSKVAKVGNEAWVVGRFTDPGSPAGMKLLRYNRDGQAIAAAEGVALPVAASTLSNLSLVEVAGVAPSGSNILVGWIRSYRVGSDGYRDVVVREFDESGNPATPELVLSTAQNSYVPESGSLAGVDGAAVFTWLGEGTIMGPYRQFAVGLTRGMSDWTAGMPVEFTGQAPETYSLGGTTWISRQFGNRVGVFWNGRPSVAAPYADNRLHGFGFTGGTPSLSGSGLLEDEKLLDPSNGFPAYGTMVSAGSGDKLMLLRRSEQRLFPESTGTEYVTEISEVSLGSPRFASGVQSGPALRIGDSLRPYEGICPSGSSYFVRPGMNRYLLFCVPGESRVFTRVIWRTGLD